MGLTNGGVSLKGRIEMVFKPKGSEERSHRASCRLIGEMSRIALKSINKDEYSEKLGHSSHTQKIF